MREELNMRAVFINASILRLIEPEINIQLWQLCLDRLGPGFAPVLFATKTRNLTLAGFASGSLGALAAFADKRPYAGTQVIAFPRKNSIREDPLPLYTRRKKLKKVTY